MDSKVTDADSFFAATESTYKTTDLHYVPIIISKLFEAGNAVLVVAANNDRNRLKAAAAGLRSIISPELVIIQYEPRYNFMRASTNRSRIEFTTTGDKGVGKKLRYYEFTDILLYGVDNSTKWDKIVGDAAAYMNVRGGNLMIHRA